ncbi:MAG: gamma-glutamyltransferase [Pseudomonadota bacterium]
MPVAVAVATSSELAADAARTVIDRGGNAVDAALAAALMTMNTEPGVCALAGGAFITIKAPGQAPITIDGYAAVPGIGHSGSAAGWRSVDMDYGGGVTTIVGPASVAVPGTPAAVCEASRAYGVLPAAELLAPTIDAVRQGFPLSQACHTYLQHSGRSVFETDPAAFQALHPDGQTLLPVGGRVIIEGLADTLQELADEGWESFYSGAIAREIVTYLGDNGACMTAADLARYAAHVRPALVVPLGDWQVALNPPPAVGGSMLGAMLRAAAGGMPLLEAARAALQYRRRRLDFSTRLAEDSAALVDLASSPVSLARELGTTKPSAATVHTSATDSDGLACAVTASAGSGAGAAPPGTGLSLNNCLGELELNRHGLALAPPGTRLPSNMAPTVAWSPAHVLAIGSPGADRITTALAQVLARRILAGENLQSAISAPRWHVDVALTAETSLFTETLCTEPGAITEPPIGMAHRAFADQGMYFGGVGAVEMAVADGTLTAVADARRTGATVCPRR